MKPAKPTIDIRREAGNWSQSWPEYRKHTRALMLHALRYFPMLPADSTVSILFSDDLHIQELNRQYRRKNKPTNVLSFPAQTLSIPSSPPLFLGDIILAYETTQREAKEKSISFSAHAAHLLIHGFLHLIGYDHIIAAEAERMESLEALLLQKP